MMKAADASHDELFGLLVESLDAVFYVTELPARRVVYVSPAFERLWGLAAGQLLDAQAFWQKHIHPADRQRVEDAFLAFLDGRGPFHQEYRIVLPSGEERWIRDRARVAARDPAGAPVRVSGLAEDVTEYVHAIEALRHSEESLRDAARWEGEFVATVSHELRTPLNAVLGWVGLLAHETADDALRLRAIAAIERNARAQLQIVDDLLDIAAASSVGLQLHAERLLIRDVLAASIDSLRPAATLKQVELIVDLEDSEMMFVLGDAGRLRQVFWNLLGNAIKFSAAGGHVAIHAVRDGVFVRVQVTDRGVGIPSDLLPHVFDKFRQGSDRRGGLGLGLALVRSLTHAHAGEVRAHSDGPGRGAVFTVRLPLVV